MAEELELAANVCVPDNAMAPVTATVPVVDPPTHDPADSDVAFAVSPPLPGVYVLLALWMVSAPPIVTAPDPAVKSPPFKVRPPEVVTVFEPETVVAPPVMVMDAIVEEPPTLVSTETFEPMMTAAPAAFAATPGTHCAPLVPFQVHEPFPDQVHRAPLLQLLERNPLE